MIVVDTSVWIDFLRGRNSQPVVHLTEMIEADEGIAITDIILGEVLQGAPSEREAARLHRRFSAFEIYRLEGIDDFRRAAWLYRQCRDQGMTVKKTLDCLIATVCVREGLPILHSDSDYDRLAACTDLQVVAVS
ncbi:MAG TPA: PIN domain nuclease [Acidimicrobiia bacterium]|nr:PIN domain nuclease [Acidimicrobiia bacterium]